MKCILLRSNLVTGLTLVERAISSNSNLPILSSVLLEADENKLYLTSTNLEMGIRFLLSGKVLEKGKVVISFSTLFNLVRNLHSERVTLETKDDRLLFTTDNYEASLQSQPAKEFPILPTLQSQECSFVMQAHTLQENLASVVVATQYSEIRPEISGVFFSVTEKNVTLAATDGFRLAERVFEVPHITLTSGKDYSFILPYRTTGELLKIFSNLSEDVLVAVEPHQILFTTDNLYIVSRLLEGKFPDYQAIIPKHLHSEVVLKRQEFIDAVRLVSSLSGRTNDMTLTVHDSKKFLELYSSDSALGENKYRIPAKVKGEEFHILFNWRYVLDGLKIYESDEVMLGISPQQADRPGPAVIRNSSFPHLNYVLMPIRG